MNLKLKAAVCRFRMTTRHGRNTMFDEITEKIETVMGQLNALRGHL